MLPAIKDLTFVNKAFFQKTIKSIRPRILFKSCYLLWYTGLLTYRIPRCLTFIEKCFQSWISSSTKADFLAVGADMFDLAESSFTRRCPFSFALSGLRLHDQEMGRELDRKKLLHVLLHLPRVYYVLYDFSCNIL